MISLKRMSFSYVINKHQIWEEKFWVSILVLLLALFGHFSPSILQGLDQMICDTQTPTLNSWDSNVSFTYLLF